MMSFLVVFVSNFDIDDVQVLVCGVVCLFWQLGYSVIFEFILLDGWCVDLFCVGCKGEIVILEIKFGVVDFCVDNKWMDYFEYCDIFYFVVLQCFLYDFILL